MSLSTNALPDCPEIWYTGRQCKSTSWYKNTVNTHEVICDYSRKLTLCLQGKGWMARRYSDSWNIEPQTFLVWKNPARPWGYNEKSNIVYNNWAIDN